MYKKHNVFFKDREEKREMLKVNDFGLFWQGQWSVDENVSLFF